jgi:sulfite reductase (NADPH) flavoprotein alpha-component
MLKQRTALPIEDRTADSNPFDDGRAAGRAAIAGLLKTAPLKAYQVEWLSGFLQGLVETTQNDNDPDQPLCSMTVSALKGVEPNEPLDHVPDAKPYTTRIVSVESFNAGDDEEWLSVTLDVEGSHLQYRPGSTLALWPTNDPEEVRKVLRALGVSAQLTVATARGAEPAWQVLLERVNISMASRQTIELLAEYSRSESEADSLRTLSEAGALQGKSVLSLLRRFPSARPPLEGLLATLSPLEPALVPIASSSLDQPNLLSFTARVVLNPGAWGEVGAATRARYRMGEWLAISVDRQHTTQLTDDDLTPAIVIADGPCIAFARALVAERRARQAKGRNWIIGLGMRTTSFPFSRELAAWHKAGAIGRYDVSTGSEATDTTKLLDSTEDILWRWLVDHSQIFVVSTNAETRRTVVGWLESVIARRQRLDSAAAGQKLEELRAKRLIVEIPSP